MSFARSRLCGLIGAAVLGGAGITVSSFAVVSSVAVAVTAVPSNVHRIAGSGRLATAIATSQDQFAATGSASAVVLARADTFPDALAGGPLAAKVHGPLLLTPSAALDPSVQAEIVRVAPAGSTVYILGGTAAISTAIDTTLTASGFVPKRISGADRFATSVAVAGAMGNPTTVFEATGLNFPDALAGGPAAIKSGGVILLTNGAKQAAATAAYLAAHTGGAHYALGGPASKADPAATPLVGDDRFWTSAAVASMFFKSASTIGAATGLNFPDALAAGSDLAAKGSPLLLVPTSGALPAAVVTDLFGRSSAGSTNIVVFGGTASVGDDVAAQLGVLGGAAGTAASETADPVNTGQFGVSSQQVVASGHAGKQTVVVDGSSGAITIYKEGAATVTSTGPTKAAFGALPLKNPDGLKTAVNTMFASFDTAAGLTGDADELFTINAEQVFLNPVASPSLRLAVYAALASDDGGTSVSANVKDSTGRAGVEIFAKTGAGATDKGKISYIVDPATWTPLEDSVLDSAGGLVERQTVLSLTTTATAPTNPYAS
jgi:hypothetical protein